MSATFSIAAANLSLGFSLYTDRATCDADGIGIGYKAITDKLVGLAVIENRPSADGIDATLYPFGAYTPTQERGLILRDRT